MFSVYVRSSTLYVQRTLGCLCVLHISVQLETRLLRMVRKV